MLDEVLAVAAVDPQLADAGMTGGDLVERLARAAGLRTCCSRYTSRPSATSLLPAGH